MPESKPKWERGYRMHGYWLNGQRVGWVGLSSVHFKPTIYNWGMDSDENGFKRPSVLTLKEAKRAVEEQWGRYNVADKPLGKCTGSNLGKSGSCDREATIKGYAADGSTRQCAECFAADQRSLEAHRRYKEQLEDHEGRFASF